MYLAGPRTRAVQRCRNGRPDQAGNVRRYTELLLFGGRSAGRAAVLAVPELGCAAAAGVGAAAALYRLLLARTGIGAMAAGTQGLCAGEENH